MISLTCLLLAVALAAARYDRPGRWRAAAAVVILLGVALAGARIDPIGRKVVGSLLLPVGLLWLALLGTTVAAVRRRYPSWLALVALTLVFSTVGNGPLVAAAARAWEATAPRVDWRTAGPFDAVLVLGGGSEEGPYGPELGAAGDRVMLGARLWHAKQAKVLLASGRGVPGRSEARLSVQTERLWRDVGVPAQAILRLDDPWNTRQEIEGLRRVARERGWGRLGLVTSALHMRRALTVARELELEVTPLPADFVGPPGRIVATSFIPSGSAFRLAGRVAWEILGTLVGA